MNAFTGWMPFGGRGGATSAAASTSQTSQTGQIGNENSNTGNQNARDNNTRGNDPNNIELPDNLWEDTRQAQEGGNADGNAHNSNNNNNNNGNNGGGQQPSAFEQYVAGLDFAQQITPEMQQQFANGDFSSLNELMNNTSRQVFSKALQDMNRLMDAKVSKAVETAVQQANAHYRTSDFVSRMENRLEYTKDPNIAPVARSVLAQFVRKGDEIDMAIKKVDAFFKKTGNLVNGGSPNGRQGAPGNNGFRGQPDYSTAGRGNNGQEEDWVAYMTQAGHAALAEGEYDGSSWRFYF